MKFYCVTPCLNVEDSIEETMLSVLNQSIFQDLEHSLFYSIRDGGSSDNTVDLINQVIERFSCHENIQIVCRSESDDGMYDALVKGFQDGSSADVYCYINAGDYFSKHAFDIVSSIFTESGIEFLTGLNSWYNEKGHLVNFGLPFSYNKNLYLKGFYGTVLPFVQQESTFWSGRLHKKLDYTVLRSLNWAGDFYLWKVFMSNAPLYIVSAWLGGFKIQAGQLSEKYIDEYKAEVVELSIRPNMFDFLIAYSYKFLGHLPNKLKKRLSNHIFDYSFVEKKYKLK